MWLSLRGSITSSFIPTRKDCSCLTGCGYGRKHSEQTIIWEKTALVSQVVAMEENTVNREEPVVIPTDIHQRYQTSYTTPCNSVVSHGAQFGGLRVFADRTRKNKCQTNAFTIFAVQCFYACLSSRSDRSTYRLNMHRMNHVYFDYVKNPKTPKFSPMPG